MEKPHFRRRIGIITAVIIFLGIAVVIAGTVWYQSIRVSAPTYRGAVENISVGTIGEYSSLIFIAEERGYFKSNGLNVTTKEYESGAPAVADLLAGKIDMTTAADFVGVRNSFKNEDFKILATMVKGESFHLIVRSDHQISKATDLKGKRVGLTRKTAGEFHLGQFLSFNQLSMSDITVVDQSPSQLAELINKGDIDAMVSFEPHIYKTKTVLGNKINVWSVQGDQNLYSLLYGTGKLTRERPEVIKRYLNSIVMAEEFISKNDYQARSIVARRLNYSEDFVNTIWPRFTFGVTLDQELLIAMDDQARWVIENGLVTSPKIPNYLRFIYLDGLETVKPEGVTIIR